MTVAAKQAAAKTRTGRWRMSRCPPSGVAHRKRTLSQVATSGTSARDRADSVEGCGPGIGLRLRGVRSRVNRSGALIPSRRAHEGREPDAGFLPSSYDRSVPDTILTEQ